MKPTLKQIRPRAQDILFPLLVFAAVSVVAVSVLSTAAIIGWLSPEHVLALLPAVST
ncbi:MAG TPA: hypothetical protein PKJ79_09815 [Quisquiliibacterium sp.]|nr:hypothetical protein [Quisquiliibacterium sp.]